MIERQAAQALIALSKGFPIVAVTGPRQSGKTTLVQNFLDGFNRTGFAAVIKQ